MAEVPWLRILDTVIGVADVALSAAGGRSGGTAPAPRQDLDVGTRPGGSVEAGLAGVVVAALKEAFDRDARRMHFERELADEARLRAERAQQLELLRQAGDREIGRLRMLAAVAAAAWAATLVWSGRLIGGGIGARVSLGAGWLFLLGAVAASFIAQSRVAAAIDALAAGDDRRAIRSGASGAFALWLMIVGLALAGLAALLG
jgi:hypothetical protein